MHRLNEAHMEVWGFQLNTVTLYNANYALTAVYNAETW